MGRPDERRVVAVLGSTLIRTGSHLPCPPCIRGSSPCNSGGGPQPFTSSRTLKLPQDKWKPIREARLAREAAEAEAARLQAEQEHTARVELVADALRAHPELLARDPAEPGQGGRDGMDGRDGRDGIDGAPALMVLRADFERHADLIVATVLTMSDGTTRRYTVERGQYNRPTGLSLDQ